MTHFTFHPNVIAQAHAHCVSVVRMAEPALSTRLRVLLVARYDRAAHCACLLEQAGYEVVTVTAPRLAQSLLGAADGPFDALVLDAEMAARRDGARLRREGLRRMFSVHRPVTLVLSGAAEPVADLPRELPAPDRSGIGAHLLALLRSARPPSGQRSA